MGYIILVFVVSFLLAVASMKIKCKYYIKVIFNLVLILMSIALLVLTGIKERSLLIFMLLFLWTVLGILMHIITPIILNLVGCIFCKIMKQDYVPQSFEQMMEASSGHRMHSCVFIFTMMKMFLYILLFASFAGLI